MPKPLGQQVRGGPRRFGGEGKERGDEEEYSSSGMASARRAITASTTNNAANGTSGAAVAGSIRTITGNTNSSIGAA